MEHDYLQFIIKDETGKVRGQIIGSLHDLEPQDAALNSSIQKTVETAHTIWMELPPGHPLLAPQPAERTIENSVKHISAHRPSMKELANPALVDSVIQTALTRIQKETNEDNFFKVQQALDHIKSPASKLAFCRKIREDMASLNQLNLETVLAEIPGAKEKMRPLEEINLKQVLNEADDKITVIEKARHDNVDPAKQKWVKEQEYNAWRDGDAENLKRMMGQNKFCYLMPKSHKDLNEERDINIAARIADVVKTSPAEDAVFVVGAGHLVDPRENNVLNNLRNKHFTGDMSGWTIEQVKNYGSSEQQIRQKPSRL